METLANEMIEQLKAHIPEGKISELEKILAYGEKIKAEGEMKKKEFWNKYNLQEEFDRDKILNLLEYKRKHRDEIESKYKYLESMKGIEREMFIQEYLHDDMLYSGKCEEEWKQKQGKRYDYKDWKNGDVVMDDGVILDFIGKDIGDEGVKLMVPNLKLKEWMHLSLSANDIGDEGAKAIAENLKLSEGVQLSLGWNKIGAKGAKAIAENLKFKDGVYFILESNDIGDEGMEAIAENLELKDGMVLDLQHVGMGAKGGIAISKMKLKDGVDLSLCYNEIGDEGAEAIAQNLELKEGVTLNLWSNQIGDEGAKAIMEKMELKEGVALDLRSNNISDKMKQELKKWEKSYHDKGINCTVLVEL